MSVKLDLSLSEWPIFYIDGEPYIYDDTNLFLDENGEPVGQHPRHSRLAIFLYNLLSWRYRNENCVVTFDLYLKAEIELALMAAADASGEEVVSARVSPDVAFIRGVTLPDKGTYVVDEDGPPPNVIFEIGSENTYQHDLNQKVLLYAKAYRTKEYFTYDPHRKRLWKGPRIKGWRLVDGKYVELDRDERGWMWSEELESWLVEDGRDLWLHDKDGNKYLSSEEEATQYKFWLDQEQLKSQQEYERAENARAEAEQERDRAEQEKQRAEAAKMEAQQEHDRAEQEKRRADEAEARIARLEEELRKRNQSDDEK